MTIINCDEFLNPNRKQLQDVVPLSTPYKINIEPSNLCNIACNFCPTANRKLVNAVRKNGVMSFELFRKIVSDLGEFDSKIKLVEFFIDGEPLVNKDFPEMARYLRDSNVAEAIRMKTNGLLLTPPLIERLANAGLDRIDISIVAPHARGYEQIAGIKMDYDKFVGNVALLFKACIDTKIYINMRSIPGFTEADEKKFFDDFGGISDFIGLESLHGWSGSDVIDLAQGTEQHYDENPIACPWPLYRLTIAWNGVIRTCTVDWAWKTLVGDVSVDSLKEIWNGEQMYQFRKMHLEGRRSENPACNNCALVKQRLDNIDDYRDEILKKLKL